MISFEQYFTGSELTEDSSGFTINIVGTEDGDSKNYTISVEADTEEEAESKAKEKVAEMIDNASLPSDASIQNIEQG
jgi:hypothetical protein